jgi:hypothetical protein
MNENVNLGQSRVNPTEKYLKGKKDPVRTYYFSVSIYDITVYELNQEPEHCL